jgi:8-amino-7-oxononanoate synthase
MDLFNKVVGYTRVREAKASGLYPYFLPLENSEGPSARFGGRDVTMLGSNNYLGLTTHPRVRQAASDAALRFGTSCTGSRFLNGTIELHVELERRLAQFHGAEDVQTFTTGYQANVGVISALVGRGDYVVLDKDDHASIVDGCLLASSRGAELRRFKHSDLASLENVLAGIPEGAGTLVIVDGVYSMGGDIAPLPEIVALCRRHGARIMVDDAHGVGVTGPGGRGTVALFGLEDQIDVVTGTFSKSLASVGGYVYGRAPVVDFIRHNARALLFSASLPPSCVATVLAALSELEGDPGMVDRLGQNADHLRNGLRALGFDVGRSDTPIIPVILRDELVTIQTWRALLDAGVYTNPVVPPGVQGTLSLLRTSCMATHTADQLDRALGAFGRIGAPAGVA